MIVEILWAIDKVVLSFIILFRLSWTISSDLASNALVASSNNKMLAFLKTALAIAILYFYPPEIYDPLGPTLL